jgi:SAM-dependent methyltransferase
VAPERLLAARLRAQPGVRYVSIDLASSLAMVRMDVTRLAFRDSIFDAILCLHVLEHIPDDRSAMREFLRVLRPGGWAILQSPIDAARPHTFEDWGVTSPAERERVFGQRDHVRIYGRDYVGRLGETGFRVEEHAFARELTPDEARRFGIDTEETITLCTRP